MKPLLFFGSIWLFLCSFQSRAEDVMLRTTTTGETFTLLGAGETKVKDETVYGLRYQTPYEITDLENIRREVRYIWLDFRHDMERSNLNSALIVAAEKQKSGSTETQRNYGFQFTKNTDGSWSSSDHELNRWLELFQTKDIQTQILGLKGWANRGDLLAMKILGILYLTNSDPSVKDPKEALKWFTSASEKGDATADFYIGQIYMNGQGVTKDGSEAVKWCKRSAESGNALGELALAQDYLKGMGVTKDNEQAFVWTKKAADQGLIMAEGCLGSLYLSGLGVAKDLDKAYSLVKKAAEEGDVESESNLSYIYFMGSGTPKNCDEGFKWAQLAANQGSPEGEDNLGSYYEEGCGTPKDLNEALKWFTRSKDHGCVDGANDYTRLKALMPK